MRRLGIGDVCRLLDIKPHILRYWEAEIPLLDPAKNAGGRRVYGDRELNLLYRLKYLIQEKRYTVEGAKLALLDGLAGGRENEKAAIVALRKHLLDARGGLVRLREESRRFTEKSLFPPGQGHLRRIWEFLPRDGRANLIAGLMDLTPEGIALASRLAARASRQPVSPPALRISAAPGGLPEDPAAAEAALAGGRVGLLTLLPDNAPAAPALAALESLAVCVREAGYGCGTALRWFIFAGSSLFPRIRSLVRGRWRFLLDPGRVETVRVPDFPFLDGEGRILVRPDGGVAVYPSTAAGALLLIGGGVLDRSLDGGGIDTLYFLPLNRYSLPFPRPRLLAGHFGTGADVTALLFRGENGPATTGVYAARAGLFRGREDVPVAAEPARVTALMPGSRSAEEIGDAGTEKVYSLPYFIAAGAGNRRGLLEDR